MIVKTFIYHRSLVWTQYLSLIIFASRINLFFFLKPFIINDMNMSYLSHVSFTTWRVFLSFHSVNLGLKRPEKAQSPLWEEEEDKWNLRIWGLSSSSSLLSWIRNEAQLSQVHNNVYEFVCGENSFSHSTMPPTISSSSSTCLLFLHQI